MRRQIQSGTQLLTAGGCGLSPCGLEAASSRDKLWLSAFSGRRPSWWFIIIRHLSGPLRQ